MNVAVGNYFVEQFGLNHSTHVYMEKSFGNTKSQAMCAGYQAIAPQLPCWPRSWAAVRLTAAVVATLWRISGVPVLTTMYPRRTPHLGHHFLTDYDPGSNLTTCKVTFFSHNVNDITMTVQSGSCVCCLLFVPRYWWHSGDHNVAMCMTCPDCNVSCAKQSIFLSQSLLPSNMSIWSSLFGEIHLWPRNILLPFENSSAMRYMIPSLQCLLLSSPYCNENYLHRLLLLQQLLFSPDLDIVHWTLSHLCYSSGVSTLFEFMSFCLHKCFRIALVNFLAQVLVMRTVSFHTAFLQDRRLYHTWLANSYWCKQGH